VQTKVNSAHEIGPVASTRTWKPFSAFMAILVVAIMIVSAFVMLATVAKAPASIPGAAPVAKDLPAVALAAPFNRQVNYTISNIGDANVKDSRDVAGARGTHGSTPGLPEWWLARKALYSDTVVHNTYPYWIAYNPESSTNAYNGVSHIPYGTYSFYRIYMDATDISTVATGPNKDLLYLPTLGGVGLDGGTVRLTWHSTYLTSADAASMQAGTHYANTYYGVPASAFAPLGTPSYGNDGWYWEHTGLISVDVAGAKKYFGLPGAGDLRTEFTTANVGGALNLSFWNHYLTEGSPDAIYDIFACYDYSINTGPPNTYWLKLDPSSTITNLVVRVYGYSWGVDCLMMRYLDVQGLMSNFVGWSEDYYFNATITTDRAEIHTRATNAYHVTAWKDPAYWGAAWMLEAQHYDYNDYSGPLWESRFMPYAAYRLHTPLRMQWEPGSNNFGTNVAFWNTPHVFNLAAGEKLSITLPTKETMGYMPYKGTVSDIFPKNGGGNDAKVVEMNTHQQWGEMVLGPGTFPSSLFSASYYDAASKTFTMVGPTDLARNNGTAGFPELNQTGSPMFMFDISPVSDYVMTLPAGPYQTGVSYTMTVTARNLTGAAVATNLTVNLVASAGVTLGASQHVYSVGEAGVWTTTVLFTTGGSKTITATDSLFSLDVKTTLSVTVPLPGFNLVLAKGWNMVSIPLTGGGYKASTLGLQTDDVVSGWNGTTYNQNYIVGRSPARNDFAILDSTGYWIFVNNTAETLSLVAGSYPTAPQSKAVTVPAGGGWFIIGFLGTNATRKASDIKTMYTGGTVTTVAYYDTVAGTYKTYIGTVRTDFGLSPGWGLWIYVTASGTLTYTP
jgi:hypothetical protein